MRRTSLAALLAAPLLLAIPGTSDANPGAFLGHYGCASCVGRFQKLHQHGPLFNYGPYYGYAPFEPYGPWNAYLQYNPYYYGTGYGGNGGGHGWNLFGKHCGSCGIGCHNGFHLAWGHGGWFKGHGCLSCGHDKGCKEPKCGHHLFHGHHKSCEPACTSGCQQVSYETTDATARYTGFGSVQQTAVFYAGLPTIDPTAPTSVIPAGR